MSIITKANVFTPLLDFLLLGGASLILLPAVMVFLPVETLSAWKILPLLIIIFFMLDYIGNFPHFAYSYQLMYQDFYKKVRGMIDPPLQFRYIFAGIIVPVAMVIFFVFCYQQKSTLLLKQAVNVMLLTAGWHYAKQGFGILIVTSTMRKIFYSTWERRLLLFNAHLMWVYAWVMFNTGSQTKVYFEISFSTIGFPVILEHILNYVVCISTVVLCVMFLRKYKKESVAPPVNGLTAYMAAVYLWIILRFGLGYDHPIHPVILLIPFMHSIQYIAIVMRMKSNEVKQNHISLIAFLSFILFGIVIGALMFETIPTLLDKQIPYNKSIYGTALFMFMFWIFINIHHYFIDNVIWRREGGEVKKFLFSPK